MDESAEKAPVVAPPAKDVESSSSKDDDSHRQQETTPTPRHGSDSERGSLAEGAGSEEVLEELGTMEEEAQLLEKQIAETEARMREFESRTKYMDAERERKTLERLKSRRKALSQRHIESYQRVDSKQFHAFSTAKQHDFDERWEHFFSEHNKKTRRMYHALKERHQAELAKLRDELEKKIRVPKYSTHLLAMRQKQRALARCQRYVEAETILKGADVLEAKEHEEYKRTCQQQNQLQVDMMLSQQYVDMNALRQKTKLERKVMMEDRSKEQQQLDHRLRNSMMEMNRMHTKQALVAEGKLFDTGFYTQRGAARSSKPLVGGLLLTNTTHTDNGVNKSSATTATPFAREAGEATDTAASRPTTGSLPPLKNSQQRSSKNPQRIRAGTRPKSYEKLALKEDLFATRQSKATPRPQKKKRTAAGTGGASKEQRAPAPGRRRQEFSIRKLAGDRAKGRS